MPLTAKEPVGAWIADFQKSDDPRFAGKSKAERKKMALGAYYGAIKESSEPHPLLEYTIEKTKRGVRVVHNGKVVHVAKSANTAQEWIASLADKQITESTQMVAEKIVHACLEQNFLGAESAFKQLMAEKVTAVLQEKKEEVAAELSAQPVFESMRLLATHKAPDGKHVAKVYKDTEWGEHRVRFFSDGKHHAESDYHTDDRADADDTAKSILKTLSAKG